MVPHAVRLLASSGKGLSDTPDCRGPMQCAYPAPETPAATGTSIGLPRPTCAEPGTSHMRIRSVSDCRAGAYSMASMSPSVWNRNTGTLTSGLMGSNLSWSENTPTPWIVGMLRPRLWTKNRSYRRATGWRSATRACQ
jgi:hypothetical protein